MAKQTLNTVKNWFKTALKPTQQQFWDTWDSFWHKDQIIPTSSIENLDSRFDEKADAEALTAHLTDLSAHGINNKVDKELGKGLSSNDYTSDDKQKLDGLFNYDDADLKEALNAKLTGTLATDAETQITIPEAEDSKVISRLKLFNWWVWIKTQAQTIGAAWAFNEDLSVNSLTIGRGGNSVASNTAIGNSALSSNTGGIGNTALGLNALANNTTGQANIAIGAYPLFDNTAGTGNMAIGNNSLYINSSGSSNVSIGSSALSKNTTGGNNTAIGNNAGYNLLTDLTDNNKCTFIGYQANASANNLTNSTAIGSESQVTESNQIVYGNPAVLSNIFFGKIVAPTGTTTTPSLIIPNAPSLVTTPQNGAIERDNNGRLWTTRGGVRYRLIEDDGSLITLSANAGISDSQVRFSTSNVYDRTIINLPTGFFSNSLISRVNLINNYYTVPEGGTIAPTAIKVEYLLKLNNARFCSLYYPPPYGSYSIEVVLFTFTGVGSYVSTPILLTTDTYPMPIISPGGYLFDSISDVGINLNEVSASIIERVTMDFADGTNSDGNNQIVRLNTYVKGLFIEKIRN